METIKLEIETRDAQILLTMLTDVDTSSLSMRSASRLYTFRNTLRTSLRASMDTIRGRRDNLAERAQHSATMRFSADDRRELQNIELFLDGADL